MELARRIGTLPPDRDSTIGFGFFSLVRRFWRVKSLGHPKFRALVAHLVDLLSFRECGPPRQRPTGAGKRSRAANHRTWTRRQREHSGLRPAGHGDDRLRVG